MVQAVDDTVLLDPPSPEPLSRLIFSAEFAPVPRLSTVVQLPKTDSHVQPQSPVRYIHRGAGLHIVHLRLGTVTVTVTVTITLTVSVTVIRYFSWISSSSHSLRVKLHWNSSVRNPN
jgi:hypothetical protein